jgi:hypothetical protein
MDYNLDRKVLVCESNNEKNKDKWTIQEFAEDGITIDGTYEKYNGGAELIASELKVINQVLGTSEEYSESEFITGVLLNRNNFHNSDFSLIPFSLFGTKRIIANIKLYIEKINEKNEDAIEKCEMWGSISYDTEIDWRTKTEADELQINISLNVARFNKLVELIKTQKIDVFRLNLWFVTGLYSTWDPYGYTDTIKVLVNAKDQKVIFPNNCLINLPELGIVERFKILVYQKQELDPNNCLIDKNLLDDKESEDINIHASLLDYLKKNEVALKQLSIDIKEKELTINGLEYLKNLEYLKYIDEFTMNIHSVNKSILKQLATNENALVNISRNIKENKLLIENFESSPILKSYMTRYENLLIKTHKILWLIFVLLLSIFIKSII